MFRHSKQGAIDIVSSDDVLDLETIDDALSVVEKCLVVGQPKLVFNLEKVPLIDSKGLSFLLETRDQCARRGGSFKLAHPNKLCKDILRITGVQEEIEVFDNVIVASGSFGQ